MFDDSTLRAAAAVAAKHNWPLNHLLAVAQVESGGKVGAAINGKMEPIVRFEGHYFDKRVVAHRRAEARNLGLANPKAGAVKNPASQQARWDKLIRPAAEIDKQAAYESVSWGLGQVMGAHWKALGYGSVIALVDHARRGAVGQIELMARFIASSPALSAALRDGRWTAFAKTYNGPAYETNKYDVKMAKAAKRWANVKVPAPAPAEPASARPVPKPSSAPTPVETAPAAAPAAAPVPARGIAAGFAAALIALVAGLFWSGACLAPDFIINWLGYAGRCAGAN